MTEITKSMTAKAPSLSNYLSTLSFWLVQNPGKGSPTYANKPATSNSLALNQVSHSHPDSGRVRTSLARKTTYYAFFFLFWIIIFAPTTHAATFWQIRSVDTMKTSRDQTLYKQHDLTYDEHIDKEMSLIKATGANYVTVDSAYDEAYLPWLRRWVSSARSHGLKVWYRGNFSAWHGWFGPKDMTRSQHLEATRNFIINHPDLFQDGDSFTACPECESGGPGNPLVTGDIEGFRKFMIDEYRMTQQAFKQINKNVHLNWLSINPDVAKQVIDQPTLDAIDNLITLDYFIKDLHQLESGLDFFHNKFPNAQILIGEFGAPIPEINGQMTESQKETFVQEVFSLFSRRPEIIGVNYWISSAGATELFSADLKKSSKAADVITRYFQPATIVGHITDSSDQPLSGITISTSLGNAVSDDQGNFRLLIPAREVTININHSHYYNYTEDFLTELGKTHPLTVSLTPRIPKAATTITPFQKFINKTRSLFCWIRKCE